MPDSEPENAFCVKCGNELAEGDKFCGKCGTPTQSTLAASVPSHRGDQQLLPSMYFGLIQLCSGVVIVSFFLPWLDLVLAKPSGWDVVRSGVSWHVLLAVTPPIAALAVSFLLKLLYRDPARIKTYYTWIEIVSSFPIVAFVVIVILIGKNFGTDSFKAILENLLDLVKVVGIGGWGTVLGLIGIDILTSRLYKEGLRSLGMPSDDDISEPGLFNQVADAIVEGRERSYVLGSASVGDLQRIREKIKQVIPTNPANCIVCDDKLTGDWKTSDECRQTGLCRDCFSSYLSRL
ncbi:MAG: hypothetical protein CVT49_15725 [candidate division Zixibacteria bacterium HGW-Zixibacteria-1]|nr:MAG: hypothetical protein CVT49_15725 [candidate division Zixibacteria bacterium HGW-Zixibacteria-1]